MYYKAQFKAHLRDNMVRIDNRIGIVIALDMSFTYIALSCLELLLHERL